MTPQFADCLDMDTQPPAGHDYQHRLLKENPAFRASLIDVLRAVCAASYDDAKAGIRAALAIDLDPLQEGAKSEYAARLDQILDAYPSAFDIDTLKGFFGEVFAAILIESFSLNGATGWRVPALFFQFHEAAFTKLEAWVTQPTSSARTFGRTGHDCLAFRVDVEWNILEWIKCEAKCTADHDSSLIADAHKQVSDSVDIPAIHILRLLDILKRRGDSISMQWFGALRRQFGPRSAPIPLRTDLVSYVCGRQPQRASSWIPRDRPHSDYTGGRRLEAMETHLSDVDDLVRRVHQVN